MAALLSRIERLEAGASNGGTLRAVRETAAEPRPQPENAQKASAAGRQAQAAQAAPAIDEEPASVPVELETAVAAWPAVVDTVRTRNAMLAALLADARPVAIDQRGLTVAFPAGAAFLKRKAEQDDHRRVAAEAVKTVTGQGLALHYELRENGELEQEVGAPVLSGEELVRRFIEEFDAEELLESDDHDQGEAS
jgi:DNA polymerase-3 subunit gamma/tau